MKDFVPTFSDHRRLLLRLADAIGKQQKLSFLVGSAVTATAGSPPRRGVPGVNGVIEQIRSGLIDPEEVALFEEDVASHLPSSEKYQRAMQLLLEIRGPEELNRVVRRAVLEARLEPPIGDILDADMCRKIEADVAGWSLPPAVEAIGQLIAGHPYAFQGPILTTNFDPLIEVATNRAGGRSEAIFLSADGRFDNLHSHNLSHVVHLHGYWFGTDTLHTPKQLTRDRPRLNGCLRELLRDTTLVVMAYGGWDDVITRTLFEVAAEGGERLNVAWCFYSHDEAAICEENASLLKAIEQVTGQRVVLYKGVDCHVLLPQLAKRTIAPTYRSVSIPISADASISPFSTRVEISGPTSQQLASFPCDPPPITEAWVGRERELRLLRNSAVKVATITAIGGQGKSALAAQFIREVEGDATSDFELWDWRDCREQGDQIHTKLLSLIERLTLGMVKAAHLAGELVDSVIQTFFAHLGQRRILFVFDNIDHYIDLEHAYPVLGMKALFETALTANHRSKFVFTCRPAIHIENSAAINISLAGFTLTESEDLFRAHGVDLSRPGAKDLASEAYGLTAGHMLWLNLIALQAARKPGSVVDLLNRIKRRKDAGLPDETLYSIWSSLDMDHQLVLRTMAEIVRAETENVLSSFVPRTIHFKRLQQVLKNLNRLGLVVVARLGSDLGGAQAEAYDLHPLVRQFIHETSPRGERESFIRPIVLYFETLIGQFRIHLGHTPSLSILENWTNKIELEINAGLYERALSTLNEVREPLLKAGYSEEYVRVASRLFDEISWTSAMERNMSSFGDVFYPFLRCMIQLGRTKDADAYLDRYGAISSKNVAYIGYCSMRCYAYWYRGEHELAIEWGARGRDLKAATKVDDDQDCAYHLALAERDGGTVDRALLHFLNGAALSAVVGTGFLPGKPSEFYGNIGRCLWKKSDGEQALICYKKSAILLEREEESFTILNQGYARFWIGETFLARGDFEKAYYFLRSAVGRWNRVSPPRAGEARSKIGELRERLSSFEVFAQLSDDDIERRCRRWLYD
jgi:tetratricopeptide (TPR) repeat protein